MTTYATVAAVAVVASYLGVALVRQAAHRWKWLDHPTHRGMHDRPMPRGGGLAIVLVALAVMLWCRWYVVAVAGAAIAIVSFIDDIRSLPNKTRFAVQAGAALAALASIGCIHRIGRIELGAFGCLVAFLWIVGLTNGYNFMDGIDGIAGIQGVVAGLGFFLLGDGDLRLIGIAVSAASAGFLFHNWSPARIFMGDVGAAFLGYLFAVMAIRTPGGFLVGILFVWPFVLDTSLTLARRALKRENIFTAHRSHLYQRMVQSGFSHAQVATLYALLAASGVAAAWLVAR